MTPNTFMRQLKRRLGQDTCDALVTHARLLGAQALLHVALARLCGDLESAQRAQDTCDQAIAANDAAGAAVATALAELAPEGTK